MEGSVAGCAGMLCGSSTVASIAAVSMVICAVLFRLVWGASVGTQPPLSTKYEKSGNSLPSVTLDVLLGRFVIYRKRLLFVVGTLPVKS